MGCLTGKHIFKGIKKKKKKKKTRAVFPVLGSTSAKGKMHILLVQPSH